MAKITIIESPFAGEVEENLAYVREAMHDSLMRGEAPFASHALYTQAGVLDDTIEVERNLGIEAGFEFRKAAAFTAFYIDHGISSGMKWGARHAAEIGCPVVLRSLRGAGPEIFRAAANALDIDLPNRVEFA